MNFIQECDGEKELKSINNDMMDACNLLESWQVSGKMSHLKHLHKSLDLITKIRTDFAGNTFYLCIHGVYMCVVRKCKRGGVVCVVVGMCHLCALF